jgi:hypothetical protein
MNDGPWVRIRLRPAPIENRVVVNGPHSFVGVLMSPDGKVNPIFHEKVLKAEPRVMVWGMLRLMAVERINLKLAGKPPSSHHHTTHIHVKIRDSNSNERVPICAVVRVVVGAVHGPVAVGDDPGPQGSVLGLIRLLHA